MSTLSSALSIASRLKEISKNISDAEFKNILADLSLELADAKLKIADVVEENAKQKGRIFRVRKCGR